MIYTRIRTLIIIMLCLLMIIPNNTLAQTEYQQDIQNQAKMKQTQKCAVVILNQFFHPLKNIITLDESGIYEFGNFNGTIIIAKGDITLRDTNLEGNLIISKNVSDEEIILENVITLGCTKIYGDKVVLNLNGKFKEISILANLVNLQLKKGSIENLIISENGKDSTVNIYKDARVNNLLIEAKSNIMGKGIIEKAIIKVNGVKIEQIPETIEHENGITVSVGYNWNKARQRNSNNNGPTDIEIVSAIKKDLKLLVQNAAGHNVIPKIVLPYTDAKDYHSNITWESDNPDFLEIEGSEAIIFRRGINNSTHSDKHDDNSDEGCESEAINAISLMSLGNDSINSCETYHDDSITSNKECGSTGGNITLVVLTATITKGQYTDTKTFDICIPWGWGKAITILENGSIENGHVESAPIPKVIPEQTLYIGQYPLIMSSVDLALYGEKITNATYEKIETTTGSAIKQYLTEKADITTGSSIVAIEILDDSLLKITPLETGTLIVKTDVKNSLGKSKVTFNIKIEDSNIVEDSVAVAEAYNHLKLKILNNGKGPKQTNKFILPNTDNLGYGTFISWESNNEKFISINGEEGIINRRGEKSGDIGCNDISKMLISSDLNLSSCNGEDDSHDDSDCGGSSSQGGKSTIVELKATISKGNIETTKNIIVKIPWGWGRAITINYE